MGTIENRGPTVAAVASTIYAIALVAVSLRCYVRLRIIHAFGLDDWFMLFALISFTFNTATCLAGVVHGTGRHYWDLTAVDLSKALMFWWYCYLTYCTSMILAKCSIGFFLLRITPSKIHRYIIYAALGLTIFCTVAFFFIALFQCSPVWWFWVRSGPGSCIDIDIIIDITYAYSATAIITDVTLTVLPIMLVWKLQMDRKTKIALIPILGMACIASAAVAVRLSYVQDFRTNDFLFATADIATWSQTEQGLAITAGSLATLQPLLKKTLIRLGLTGAGGSSGSSNASPIDKRSGHFSSSGNRRAPRSMFSLTTFTKMDDVEDEAGYPSSGHHSAGEQQQQQHHHQQQPPLPPLPDARTSLRKDETDYRVSIHADGFKTNNWSAPLRAYESQEALKGSVKGSIKKETTYGVV